MKLKFLNLMLLRNRLRRFRFELFLIFETTFLIHILWTFFSCVTLLHFSVEKRTVFWIQRYATLGFLNGLQFKIPTTKHFLIVSILLRSCFESLIPGFRIIKISWNFAPWQSQAVISHFLNCRVVISSTSRSS